MIEKYKSKHFIKGFDNFIINVVTHYTTLSANYSIFLSNQPPSPLLFLGGLLPTETGQYHILYKMFVH